MRSRVLWRRLATAVGIYGAAVIGFLGTVVAARLLDQRDFGLLAIVVATTGFLQLFLDLTVEEAVVKFGFRHSTAGEWGLLRRVFQIGLALKIAGGIVGGLGLVALAPFADSIFGKGGLTTPLLLAALLPAIQSPEGIASAALIVRGRYDLRAGFLAFSMLLRLAGLAAGASFGLTEAVLGMVAAQGLATLAVGAGGWLAFRRFPAAPPVPLGDERRAFRRFVVSSSLGSGLVSVRGTIPVLTLGVVAPTTDVANFRVAQAPQAGFASLSAPARLILLAEQTREFERGRPERVFAQLGRYMAGTAALMAVVVPLVWIFMPDLVRLVYGAKYLGAVNAARLILLAAAVQLVWGWSKSFPVSIGRPGLRILAHALELVLLVPLLFVLGDRYGATGAAAAVLGSTGLFAAVWAVLLVRLRREPLPAIEPAVQ